MTKSISLLLLPLALCLTLLAPASMNAQTLSIPAAALGDSTARTASVARLARQAAAVYRNSNALTQLDGEFRLQLLAGRPVQARETLTHLRKAQATRRDTTPADHALDAQYEIYLRAKQLQADSTLSFADGFARAFRERFAKLDDRGAALVARTLSIPAPSAPETPWGSAGKGARDTTIALTEAVHWLRAVQVAQTYQEIGTLAAPLIREDDKRRYII